ncbi:hypothetical protein PspLS_05785 [Pyricularia sp. CBS 133598]|nr:hypothetical protein PspLS_05785 [Pyricularia sp. CBS 133598]
MAVASEDSLPTLKVLLVGSSNVGKSALLTRYCHDKFEPEDAAATIGIDYKRKRLAVYGKAYQLNLFDTAGQERFRTLSTSYYRGAHGVIIAYDISNRRSFAELGRWFDEVKSNTVAEIALFLVGTKLDIAATNRAVSYEEGMALAQANGAQFCEASSKTRENVRKPFVDIVNHIVQEPVLLKKVNASRNSLGTVKVNKANAQDASWLSCAC